MSETQTLSRAEYADLQRRYLGLDWPEDAGEFVSLDQVSPRMGVPVEELAADLAQLRLQRTNSLESMAFRDRYLEESKMPGKKGLLYFAAMIGFCFILFAILMLSVKVLVPQGRNLQDKTPEHSTATPEIMPQPGN